MAKRGNKEGTIYKRADGRWEAKIIVGYDANGKPKRKSVYGKTRKEVNEKKLELEQQLKSGTYVELSKTTFGEWYLRWMKVYLKPTIDEDTYADYYNFSLKHIIPTLGDEILQQLSNPKIQEVINHKQTAGRADGKEGGLSSRRIHMLHNLIKRSLDKAVKLNLIQKNPAEDISLPPKKHKEMTTLSRDEVIRYLEAAKNYRLYAAFLLVLTSGLRLGELLGIPVECFHYGPNGENSYIEIVQTIKRGKAVGEDKSKLKIKDPKTEASRRIIPLLPEVARELKRHLNMQREERLFFGSKYNDHGLLFQTSVGTPVDPHNCYRTHLLILKRAGLKRIRFHELRHTFATLLLQDKEDPSNVSALLGHTKTSTTLDIYGHSTDEGKIRAITRLGNILKEA